MSLNRYKDKIVVTNTTTSNSITTGSILSNGGIATLDNISVANQLQLFNSGYYVGLKAPSLSGSNIVLTLPSALPSISGQFLMSDTSGNLSFGNATPVTSTFSGNQNVTNANVTGLSFSSGSFEINMTVSIVATTNLTQCFKLYGVLSNLWNFNTVRLVGDQTNVTFSINSGQVQYTSSSYPGFVSLTFSWTTVI